MKLLLDIRQSPRRLRDWLAASISNRITFAALSLAMAIALVLGLSSYGMVAALMKRSIKAELDGQARLTLQKLQGDLQGLSADFATMSANSFIANGLVDSLGRDTYLLPFLHEHKQAVPFQGSIILCDFRGAPIASNNAATDLPEPLTAGVQEVLATARPKVNLQNVGRAKYLVLIQPVIFPPTGQAEGALVEMVDLDELFVSETRHLGPDYAARLIAAGSLAASSGKSADDRDLISVQHRLQLGAPLNDLKLTVQIGLPRAEAERPLHLLTLIYCLSGAALLFLVLKFAKETSRRLTRPLISLSTTASLIAASGSLDLSAEVTGRDEVGTLAKVFNDMLKKVRASHEELESQVESRTSQLQEAHDLLELRVAQRTRELTEANSCLEKQMETNCQLEQQLRQVQKMEAVGTLAGGIAHDFNNILTVIGAYSSLTTMQMEESDPLRENLDRIMLATEKAANLTRSLLAFSRKQVMDPEDVDLNSIITNVENFLIRVIGEDVKLTTKLAPGSLWVHLDRGQIEQVLMNLAANARDAMPRGGVLAIETTLQTLDEAYLGSQGSAITPGSYVTIAVSDSGCGMEQITLRKIFEPFYTTKEVGKGTGLGLAMVYGIVNQHNGHITVYSEPGHGTTFRIYLPALTAQPVASRISSTSLVTCAGGNEAVLVAEDDAEVREVMQKILGEAGYQVMFAVDGQEAVQKFRQHSADIQLVIMDMIMPNKSGKEAYNEIVQLEPTARILFSSGYTADFIRSRGELHEGADLIMKPVHPNELLKKVRQMLDAPAAT